MIIVKQRISGTSTDNANRRNKKLTLKNNAPFKSCISKINYTFVDNLKDLDFVTLMWFSINYSITLGHLWNYYRDEVNDSANENNDANNYRRNNNKATISKSLEYKEKVIESTPYNYSRLTVEVVVSLKYLVIFENSFIFLWLAVK